MKKLTPELYDELNASLDTTWMTWWPLKGMRDKTKTIYFTCEDDATFAHRVVKSCSDQSVTKFWGVVDDNTLIRFTDVAKCCYFEAIENNDAISR